MALRQTLVRSLKILPAAVALLLLGAVLFNVSAVPKPRHAKRLTSQQRLFREGRGIFRFDTFGDQRYWGGALRLHEAIEGKKLGGVGPGLTPKAALGVGLKVDSHALPASVVRAIKQGKSTSTARRRRWRSSS